MRTALRTIVLAIREAWNPRRLFANNEVGVWYDISDMSTLFQDSAGTTPVTAVEQPVGLILDKSKGLVLGPELDDGLATAANWTVFGTNTVAQLGDAIEITYVDNHGGAYQPLRQTCGLTTDLTVGKWYKVAGQAKVNTGSANISIATASAWTSAAITSTSYVDFVIYFLANSATTNYISAANLSAGEVLTIDNISVKELPGQHSLQATTAARPVLRAAPTRIDYDAVNDTLVATFAASLGTDCTVCRAVPSVGASILTAQTIGTTYTDNTDHCGLIIVNRALTAGETASVTAYLNAKAGV